MLLLTNQILRHQRRLRCLNPTPLKMVPFNIRDKSELSGVPSYRTHLTSPCFGPTQQVSVPTDHSHRRRTTTERRLAKSGRHRKIKLF
ncbi:hypothetical protein VTK73DRAFT_8042 [Phialemonium thermophilum]|uniref:Ribosomal protein L34 n=1 Tax=Phialemonium thermophilum TaxID=223376 RepID=A0ABR3WBB4_9PEZI